MGNFKRDLRKQRKRTNLKTTLNQALLVNFFKLEYLLQGRISTFD